MWSSSFSAPQAQASEHSAGAARGSRRDARSQLERDREAAAALNEQFEKGLLVKLVASPAGGTRGTGFDKKFSQLLGLRHGRQPEEEGYLAPGWSLEEWPRCKDHISGRGIAGNWFTSGSFVSSTLAGPYRPDADGDSDAREAGTSLYGCNRYGCGRTPESHKILAVFQPNPIVGCGFVEDAGTNQAGEFTGCATDWQGAAGEWEASRCLRTADCTFKLHGSEFGGDGRGAWRVDGRLLPSSLRFFSGRFDPDSEGTRKFVADQMRYNPKVSPQQVAANARHHTMGYNEVMVQVGTPMMLLEEMRKHAAESPSKAGRFGINHLRLWQCRTNGVAAFARVRPPPSPLDEHARQVENCRYEVFRTMRDGYDKACGRPDPTPILFFDMAAEHNPFSACDMQTLFPSQGPCDYDAAQPPRTS